MSTAPSSRLPAPLPATPSTAVGQELLAEFIRYGRQRPFEEIVRRYAAMVFNVCYRISKDKHDAEDATQAVFLTLAVQAKRGAEIKALGPWLQQVAKRLSLDVRRGKKRRRTREERHHDEQSRRQSAVDGDGLPTPDLDELKTILHEELQKLPAKYRLPLILHYFGGMTREEMAAELDCKPSTLGVRIFRGREMLAGRLSGRGVHLSAGAMAVAIGYLVKHTVTSAMVARTSQAAAALASGSADLTTVAQLMASHEGSTAAAARVVGLTRRASHVLVIGKVRVTVAVALLAGTSLGASVKAFTLLPPMGMQQVRQLLTDGVTRLVRPMLGPLSRPMRADTGGVPPVGPVGPALMSPGSRRPASGITSSSPPIALPPIVPPTAGSGAPGVVTAATSKGAAPLRVDAPAAGVAAATPAAAGADRLATAAGVAASPAELAASVGRRGSDASAIRASTPPLLMSTDAPSAPVDTLLNGGAMTASAANDLYVPAAGGDGSPVYYLGSAAGSQLQILQVPAIDGSVTESDGIVRGYGRIDRTGTLSVTGKVVADGDGVDRTLDLTSFSAVTIAPASASSGAAATGWYAADHGRLSLSLVRSTPTGPTATPTSAVVGPVTSTTAASGAVATSTAAATPGTAAATGPTVFTWGADPSEAVLTPVNSVRLTVYGGVVPTALSLLSPDRADAPAVPAADGAPIGIWEIDPATTPLAAVDLVIRYDDHLVAELGGNEADVELWTMASAATGWQGVDDASFSLDLPDHIVSGSATDVTYFAVTVPPAADVDVAQIIAHPAAQLAPNVVPEPTAVAAVATLAAGLLGRRRRKSDR